MTHLAIIGAGAWGTALALQAVRAGAAVTLWARAPGLIAGGENPRLPGHKLPAGITVVTELPSADLLLLAVPMQHLRAVAGRLPAGGALLACCKGLESGSLALPLEVLAEACPGRAAGVLTGPNFAHEIAAGLPAAAVVAAADAGLRAEAVAALATPSFRLYGNDDAVGAQIGGAAKNVVAIAAGAVIGAGLGENARAALITRGLAELARFAEALGGHAETVAGLSGMGDLVLTCTGASSPNTCPGGARALGRAGADSLPERRPGAPAATAAPALVARAAALGVEMPLCAVVAGVVQGRLSLAQAVEHLLARKLRDE